MGEATGDSPQDMPNGKEGLDDELDRELDEQPKDEELGGEQLGGEQLGGEELDDEEFVSRITSCQRDLRAFVLGLIPRHVDADDVLQEVNLALWRKKGLYDPKQDFIRWAFGFAALEVRSFKSRTAKSRLWFSEETVENLTDDWLAAAAFREDCRRTLASCLQKLGEPEQQVIEAKYRSRLSTKQIASQMDRPVSTIYKILNRAINSLRECVKRS